MSADFVPEYLVSEADLCTECDQAPDLGYPHTPECTQAPANRAKQALMDAFLYAYNRTTTVAQSEWALEDLKDAARAYCAAVGIEWQGAPGTSATAALAAHVQVLAEMVCDLLAHLPEARTLTTGEHR